MAKYRVTSRARDDLIDIATYTLEQWGKQQRNNYLKNIEQRFNWLADNSNLGKPRPDIGEGYYSFPEGHHIVFYLLNDKYIDIIGVPHKNMDVISYFLT